MYIALLSSLSKAILLQAETEVTAEKKSAIPLAQVTTNLLMALPGFADIFWAKLCQRAGGWPVPIVVPAKDSDGTTFTEDARRKALGYRDAEETLAEYTSRVTGMMRVYFQILAIPVDQPLDPIVRLPRYWTFFSRILKDPQMLESPVVPQVLYSESHYLRIESVLIRSFSRTGCMRVLGLRCVGPTVDPSSSALIRGRHCWLPRRRGAPHRRQVPRGHCRTRESAAGDRAYHELQFQCFLT